MLNFINSKNKRNFKSESSIISVITKNKTLYITIEMISRNPNLIVGFDVAFDESRERIQSNVESVNADLRHYILVFVRKSRCFARKFETLYPVIAILVDAYNRFGMVKLKYQQHKPNGELLFSVIDFL